MGEEECSPGRVGGRWWLTWRALLRSLWTSLEEEVARSGAMRIRRLFRVPAQRGTCDGRCRSGLSICNEQTLLEDKFQVDVKTKKLSEYLLRIARGPFRCTSAGDSRSPYTWGSVNETD